MTCSNYNPNTNQNCGYSCDCSILAIVASIIIGIIAGILKYFAVITINDTFFWVTLGVAVVYLAIVLIISANGDAKDKICINTLITVLLTGILGTILASLILLAVGFSATSVLGAIVSGGLLFFFSLMLTAVACIIKCIVKNN